MNLRTLELTIRRISIFALIGLMSACGNNGEASPNKEDVSVVGENLSYWRITIDGATLTEEPDDMIKEAIEIMCKASQWTGQKITSSVTPMADGEIETITSESTSRITPDFDKAMRELKLRDLYETLFSSSSSFSSVTEVINYLSAQTGGEDLRYENVKSSPEEYRSHQGQLSFRDAAVNVQCMSTLKVPSEEK